VASMPPHPTAAVRARAHDFPRSLTRRVRATDARCRRVRRTGRPPRPDHL